MDYSEKILYQRKKHGLSQKDIAQRLNITDRAVSKWEQGISAPTAENFYRLSKIFAVPMDYFFENEIKNNNAERKSAAGMKTLRDLYKVGSGPSSSHTMGPEAACKYFKSKNRDADEFKAVLYGSLAKTGIGHGTDRVIKKTFGKVRSIIEFNYDETDLPHPNTMDLFAYKDGKEIGKSRIMSVGGGKISIEGNEEIELEEVYPHTLFSEIVAYCRENGLSLWEYVLKFEGAEIKDYLKYIWQTMKTCISEGLEAEGIMPGGLGVQRKAKYLFSQRHIDETQQTRENRMVCAYAYAVSEENAGGSVVATAPTCGSAGVVPAVLYFQQQKRGFDDSDIIRALGVGGIIGNLIKTNASISGAECGCQAEIGSACAMAAAMLGELLRLNIGQIEYAAEIAIEHHLGLTCDPICGLVQIPCIERNAVAAMRAINAVNLSNFLYTTRKISLDKVIVTMKETGMDIRSQYRETSEGGLAKTWLEKDE